ncbi:MAG: hypothetical protein PHS37_03405 [Candidatus Omnitrophica bacterium]|nr:hypothetical protein [Candidatus Omnitrophota bacterium]
MGVELPLSLGYIREFHKADGDKPVIVYIQDAHCNYSCQKNIQAIIGFFNEKYGVDLAALEGGAGNYNFSIFTSIPDLDVREKVVDYFVREGRITGVELFAIMNPDKIAVKGLEKPDLYEKNLSVYRESLAYKEYVDKYMGVLRHYVTNLKPPIFSDSLKDFDSHKASYDENKSHLKDYVQYLNTVSQANNIKIDNFENFKRLMKLMEDEKKIDFKKAEAEREEYIDTLTKKLSKLEISALVQKSIDFKNGNLPAADFYEYLFMKGRSCDMDSKPYPELVKYKAYLEQYDSVEKDVFFSEIFNIERYVVDNLVKKDDERKLYYLADDLGIMNKLFSVSLTRQQYDYFNEHKSDLSAKNYIDFINQKAQWYKMQANINPDVEKLDTYKDKISNFYACSFDRDNAFMDNIDKYAGEKKAFFMVTGGFHTDNMKDLLKKAGYSYILITPKLEQEKYNPYFKLLSGNLSPIESMLSEMNSALALRSVFSEMGLKATWQYTETAAHDLEALYRAEKTDNKVKAIGLPMRTGVRFLTFQNLAEPAYAEAIAKAKGVVVPLNTFDGKTLSSVVLPIKNPSDLDAVRTAMEAIMGKGAVTVYEVNPDDITHSNMTVLGHQSADVLRAWAMAKDTDNAAGINGFTHENSAALVDMLRPAMNLLIDQQKVSSLLVDVMNKQDSSRGFNGLTVVGQGEKGKFAVEQLYNLDHASWRGIYVTYNTDAGKMARALVHELGAYYKMAPDWNEDFVTLVFKDSKQLNDRNRTLESMLAELEKAAPLLKLNEERPDLANAPDETIGTGGGNETGPGSTGGRIIEPWEQPFFDVIQSKRSGARDLCWAPYRNMGTDEKTSMPYTAKGWVQVVEKAFATTYERQHPDDKLGEVKAQAYDISAANWEALLEEAFRAELKDFIARWTGKDHWSLYLPAVSKGLIGRIQAEIRTLAQTRPEIAANIHIVNVEFDLQKQQLNIAGLTGLAVGEHERMRMLSKFDTIDLARADQGYKDMVDRNIALAKQLVTDDMKDQITEDFLIKLFNSIGVIKPIGVAENVQKYFEMQRKVAIAA